MALVVDGLSGCCNAQLPEPPSGIPVIRMTQAKHKRRSIPQWERDAIIAEQDGKCLYCKEEFGRPPLFLRAVMDHLAPFSHTRNDCTTNLAAACDRCNALKSNLCFETLGEAIDYIRRKRGLRHDMEELPGL